MAMDLDGMGAQMDAIPDEQVIGYINILRSNAGLYKPVLKMIAKKFGAEEWVDFIMSDKVSNDNLVRLFQLIKRERTNGEAAVRQAVSSDPILGPLIFGEASSNSASNIRA